MIILYSWQEEGQIQITYDGAASLIRQKISKGVVSILFSGAPPILTVLYSPSFSYSSMITADWFPINLKLEEEVACNSSAPLLLV